MEGYFRCPLDAKNDTDTVCMPSKDCPVTYFNQTVTSKSSKHSPILSQLIASSEKVCRYEEKKSYWGSWEEFKLIDSLVPSNKYESAETVRSEGPLVTFDCPVEDEEFAF